MDIDNYRKKCYNILVKVKIPNTKFIKAFFVSQRITLLIFLILILSY